MSYPSPGAIYRHCVMCGRPHRVWKSSEPNRGKFCSRECYSASRRAFSEALGAGLLDSFFAETRERARKERERAAAETDYMTLRRLRGWTPP
jgi:hypothetical protein